MLELIKFIKENNLGKTEEKLSFKDLTTLKIGGKISLVFYPNSIDNFLLFSDYIRENPCKMFIIGAGSNIFASDNDFKGVVVSFKELDVKYFLISNYVTAYPGCLVSRLANDLANLGYTTCEFLSGIPGTVGGAIYMNAGANDGEIKDILISAICLDDKKIFEFKNDELEFSYRKSILQRKPMVVLEAKFKFKKAQNKYYAVNKIKELKEMRKKNQPIDTHCAGCCFRNPKEDSAWKLIDKAGFRGFNINDAKVSEKHTNFIINENNASSEDLKKLIDLIKDKVKNEYNIDLVNEWILVNFDK